MGLYNFYVSFVTLAVLNVITGVFCEAAMEGARNDHELMCQQHLQDRSCFTDAFYTAFGIDAKHDDVLNISLAYDDFERVLSSPATRDYLAAMDLEVSDAWELFKLLDAKESQVIDVAEFVAGCLRLKGPARALDVAMLCYDQK